MFSFGPAPSVKQLFHGTAFFSASSHTSLDCLNSILSMVRNYICPIHARKAFCELLCLFLIYLLASFLRIVYGLFLCLLISDCFWLGYRFAIGLRCSGILLRGLCSCCLHSFIVVGLPCSKFLFTLFTYFRWDA